MKRPKELTTSPRGGWKITDPVTGIPVSQPHPMAFLQKVREARVANGHRISGNFEDEVWEEVCKQNPHIPCHDTEVPEIPMTADDVARFVVALKEMVSNGAQLVSEEEHRRRAEICLRCPKIGHVGCKSCGWMARTLTELIAGRRIHRAAELHKKGCIACGCNLDTKTYYPVEVLKAVDQKLGKQPDYWEECWMRR